MAEEKVKIIETTKEYELAVEDIVHVMQQIQAMHGAMDANLSFNKKHMGEKKAEIKITINNDLILLDIFGYLSECYLD